MDSLLSWPRRIGTEPLVIIGVGTDLVGVVRFNRLVARGGRRFLDRWFSSSEVAYCLARRDPGRHAAVRFAAKEATLKSFGMSGAGPLRWRDIEVSHGPTGMARVSLHGSVRDLADAAGITTFFVSMTHDSALATATVVAVADGAHASV